MGWRRLEIVAHRSVLVVALVIVFTSACGSALGPGQRPGDPITVAAERAGVRLTLLIPQQTYAPGEVVWVDAKVENTNAMPISWVGGGCNFPAHISAKPPTAPAGKSWGGRIDDWKKRWLDGDLAEFVFIPESAWQNYAGGGGGPICTMDVRINQLAAHDTLMLRAGWDGVGNVQAGRGRAPDGESEITAIFPMGTLAAVDLITVKATIRLTGGFITPGQALDAALADDGFRRWLEQRLGEESATAPMQGGLGTVGAAWWVTVLQKVSGPGDSFKAYGVTVKIDALTGKTLSFEYVP
ncbi:MAG: hypothetical protein E6I87_12815 [Chloroflexi bacterium]|nr:MAG: hypothetical protein E6I87_12815 [Chloroflexota bacterium]